MPWWTQWERWLADISVQTSSTVAPPSLVSLGAVLLGLVAFLVLLDDWRFLLGGWVAVTAIVAVLLLPLLPPAWALSRALAGGLDGVVLWLGARRRPRSPLRPGLAWSVRLPVILLAFLAGWQVQPYVRLLEVSPLYANVGLALVAAGLGLLALGGDSVRSTLGLLLWVNAAFFPLAWWRVPTVWVLPLTVLDILLAALGGVITASEGIWGRFQVASEPRGTPGEETRG